MPMIKTFLRGIPAGWCIALAGLTSMWAGTFCALLKPFIFPLGFMFIMYAGYALFTGRMYKFYRTALNGPWPSTLSLVAVYLGNLAGVLMIIAVAAPIGIASEAIVSAAAAKAVLPGWQFFVSAIACNILIGMAVERSTPIGWFIPIFFFVAAGFEHSIANMFYLLYAVVVGAMSLPIAAGLIFVATFGNILGAFIAAIGKEWIT